MIKILACLFMLIDHIGIIFFPQEVVLRMIGRLSMPLYAYCIARGIRYTHDIKKYFLRVLLIACVSQVPYMLMVREIKFNICFVWVLSIALIWVYNSLKSPVFRFLIVIAIILACKLIPLDYGLYGLAYVVMLYGFAFHDDDIKMYEAWTVVHLVKLFADYQSGVLQLFTLPTVAIIDLCNRYGLEKKEIKSKIITWFYPLHITMLLTLYVLHAII